MCWAICLSPKGDQNSREIGYGEIVLRPLYIHHQTLCSERFPDPTSNYELRSASSLGKSTYVVDFTLVCFNCRCASDTGEVAKEPLSKGVDRIGRESSALVDLAAAFSDVKNCRKSLPLLDRESPPFCRDSAAWR